MEHVLTHHVTILWCLKCGHLRTWPALGTDRIPNFRARSRCTGCGGRDVALRVVHAPKLGGIGYYGWELRRIADAVREAADREHAAAQAAWASGDKDLWNKHDCAAGILRRLHQGLAMEADHRDDSLARAMTNPN